MRLALLLPAWLAFAIADPGVLHSCPMHGGLPATTQQAPQHSQHSHHGAPSTPAPEHHHGSCSCIGACTPAATAFTPSAAAQLVLGWVLDASAPVALVRNDVVVRESQLRLPWANAPPRVLIERA